MGRLNLYVHYDSVTNHFLTRGVDMVVTDFPNNYLPQNMILSNAAEDFGRYDIHTDFKILRGQAEVVDYLDLCHKEKRRIANWIDFDSVEMMHQLFPLEIAELLYLFHANKALKSPFFYKLQNNYVYLTMANGLVKTYYRHMTHFYNRIQRVLVENVNDLLNENGSWLIKRKKEATIIPPDMVEALSPLFMNGLKIDFNQAMEFDNTWIIPLFVIEDQLTLLSRDIPVSQRVGDIMYHVNAREWQLEITVKNDDSEEN